MKKFVKKPMIIEAMTFEEFVDYARTNTDAPHWSIPFCGINITHENDELYLIPTLEGVMNFTPEDVLIKGIKGEIYSCKKNIFEESYDVFNESSLLLSFGDAVKAAKQGKKVARKGWNGAGMFAYIVPAASYPVTKKDGIPYSYFGDTVPYREYWALKTAQNDVATWAPSGSDSLAEDWMIVE